MARLLFLICLILAVLALAAAALLALVRAFREGRATAQEIAGNLGQGSRGNGMEKVSYAALLLLMLGVTSGLLGGL